MAYFFPSPALSHSATALRHISVLGLPLPVFLVAFPLFPLFVCLGLIYQRRADALDEAFRDLVGR